MAKREERGKKDGENGEKKKKRKEIPKYCKLKMRGKLKRTKCAITENYQKLNYIYVKLKVAET